MSRRSHRRARQKRLSQRARCRAKRGECAANSGFIGLAATLQSIQAYQRRLAALSAEEWMSPSRICWMLWSVSVAVLILHFLAEPTLAGHATLGTTIFLKTRYLIGACQAVFFAVAVYFSLPEDQSPARRAAVWFKIGRNVLLGAGLLAIAKTLAGGPRVPASLSIWIAVSGAFVAATSPLIRREKPLPSAA